MAKKAFKALTKAEEQIMQALWAIEKGTTHEIIAALQDAKPHYNTVSTMLKILNEKGFISIESIGKTNIYHPEIAKETYSKGSVKQMLQQYFGGSLAQLLSAFSSDKDINLQELESVIEEMKKQKS